MGDKIVTKIDCKNLAPIEYLSKEIKTDSLKMAIFANNGTGKSFLSSIFRLTERPNESLVDEEGKVKTDKFVSFGATQSDFSFKITDKDGSISEDFKIAIQKKSIPQIPKTKYIYHTFNEDYIDENIKMLDYEKESNIQGFILGKLNIDVSDEKNELKSKEEEQKSLTKMVQTEITQFVLGRLGKIANISRLTEYKYLNYDKIFNSIDSPFDNVSKTFKELMNDYNNVKAVPEDLKDIDNIKTIEYEPDSFQTIASALSTQYNLSSFADDFKKKVKNKQNFIEQGMLLKGEENICPFCEQEFDKKTLFLIDQYTRYLQDEEAKSIKAFNAQNSKLEELTKNIEIANNKNNARINEFNVYKTKYIPSMKDDDLKTLNINEAKEKIGLFTTYINQKIENISTTITVENELVEDIISTIDSINSDIRSNNGKIAIINDKKNKISDENINIRREMCKVVFNDLLEIHAKNIATIKSLNQDLSNLIESIRQKTERQKASKKDKVADTVKRILSSFFANKYTLHDETFRLVFKKNILDKGQTKDVLSAGEKNVIAFAYYLGDIHLKIEHEDDYDKLFFIIDDPISSMDFNHVYTLCGVIKSLGDIINRERIRFIIFTHNIEFMRVLVSNNIVKKSFMLRNNGLDDFNNNLTVPYIAHLQDVFQVSEGSSNPTHTTANSIRHIIETLAKFENIKASKDAISKYIEENIPSDNKTYTLIQDLSHGGWRSEQSSISEDDYKAICKTVISSIEKKYAGQIEYCRSL